MGVIHKISPDNGTTQYLIRDDSIAPVELTTTASQAYSVGDQFILNDGKIYKATADIAQGGTITVDTNCEEAGTVSEQLNDKQDTLTIDNTPTKNSTNPVESGGVFDTIDDVYGVMGENGAKNKIINTKTTPTVSADVTYTPQADGSITVSGTPSARSSYDYLKIDNVKANVKYNVSGLSATTNLRFEGVSYYNNGSYSSVKTLETEENTSFTLDTVLTQDATHYYVLIIKRTNNNVACTGTIYPMVWDARDTNPTYQLHAMTNAELTNEVNSLNTGLLPQLMFGGRYGDSADKAINIDTIHKPFGYMMNIITGSYFSGTAPTNVGNSFMLIGFSSIVSGGVEFGAQLAFGWSANKIAFRKAGYSAQGTTWGAWQYLTIS